MNSLQRIWLAVRATVAELSIMYYFLAPMLTIGIGIFATVVSEDRDAYAGELVRAYSIWQPEGIISLIASVCWILGTIMTGMIMTRLFKPGAQAERTLALPLTGSERMATQLLLYLGYVPLITVGSSLVVVLLAGLLAPASLLLPPASAYVVPTLLIGWLVQAATLAIWFFPAMALPKKAGLAIALVVGLAVVYNVQTRNGEFTHHVAVDDTLQLPAEDNVYGTALDLRAAARDDNRVAFSVGYHGNETVYNSALVVVAVCLYAAAYVAQRHKTA